MIIMVIKMDYLTKKMSHWLLKKAYIVDNQVDDIVYALEIVIANVMPFVSILIIGIIVHQFTKTFLFFSVFIGFRMLRDRYHAPTFLRCFILTVGSFLVCLILSLTIHQRDQCLFTLYMVCLNVLLLIIFWKKINEGQSQKSNLLYNFIFVMYNLLCIVLSRFVLHEYGVFLSVLGLIIITTSIAQEKKS